MDVIDTQDLDQAVRRDASTAHQPRNLRAILQEPLSMTQYGEHNGGMDAYYTLQAAVALALKSASYHLIGSSESAWDTNDDGGEGVVLKKRYLKIGDKGQVPPAKWLEYQRSRSSRVEE